MRHFVANHSAHSTIIYGIIGFRFEERWLQYPSRKNDFVHIRVVISVHCRRRHSPFRTVHRFADFLEFAIHLEIRGPHGVENVWSSVDLQQRVIAPLIGITDLDIHRGEFLERFLLGRLIHPVERFDSIGQRGFEIVNHFQGARFRFRREIISYIKLA